MGVENGFGECVLVGDGLVFFGSVFGVGDEIDDG